MRRATPWLIALALISGALPLAAAAGDEPKRPKSGEWGGKTTTGRAVDLLVSGLTIPIVSFEFKCKKAIGRTSLSDIELRKTPKGYKFDISAHGIVSYSDDRPDENAPIDIEGRFGPRAKKVEGRLRARPPRCRGKDWVRWEARRR